MTSNRSATGLAGHRILVGPNDIAGITSRMAMALAASGAQVLFFNANDHAFNPHIAESANLRRLYGGAVRVASRWKSKHGLAGIAGSILSRLIKVAAFLKACLWAETVVMIGGKGFFGSGLEYAFLRRLGKRVIHVFVGTASRPRYLSGYAGGVLRDGQVDPKELKRLARRTKRQARRVRGISRYASVVIENPLCGHFQERPFLNWFKLGVPLDVTALEAKPRKTDNTPPRVEGKIRVLHCPSRPEIKGSARIQAAVEKLIQEGVPLELRLVTGVPHAQVLHEIAEADFVVDQLYSDSPLAGFAAEASAFGKAAVVGGYGWDLFLQFLRGEEMPPTATCHPDKLEDCLRSLALDPARRADVGARSRAFLQTRWSAAAFAERFARVVTGDIPADWWMAPKDVSYLQGLGLEECDTRRLVDALIRHHGLGSLQVGHIPSLSAGLKAFAAGKPAPDNRNND